MLVQVLSVTTHGDKKRTTWLTDIGRRRTDHVPVGRIGSKPICIHWQRQQAAVAVVGVDGRGRRNAKAGCVAGLQSKLGVWRPFKPRLVAHSIKSYSETAWRYVTSSGYVPVARYPVM